MIRLLLIPVVLFGVLRVLILCVPTVAQWFMPLPWPYSLLQHATVHLLAIQTVVFLVLLVLPSRRSWLSMSLMTLLAACIITNIQPLIPYYIPQAYSSPQNQTFKLVTLNLHGKTNHNVEATEEFIRQTQPDILCFSEQTPFWDNALTNSEALKPYPHHIQGTAHLSLYSKFPINKHRFLHARPNPSLVNETAMVADVMVHQTPVTLLIAHPPLPMPQKYEQLEFKQINNWIKHYQQGEFHPHLILAGDLNTTPYAKQFQLILSGMQLNDTQWGQGLQPSWPAKFGPVGIPIDHVLVSHQLQTIARHTGVNLGTDHLPVIVTLGLYAKTSS
ncbi:MAG: endonuclease/exonuclease/phosphatase family protein [Vampirovibrio sp.]|nr:endonuclease/exonuclease/phosphatase family protein [Vampirovibrio sp.]